MKKYILGILTGLIIACGFCVTAAVLYNSSEVGFTPTDSNWHVNNVEDAINDLYKDKATAVQVATLTTQGATYTMQNDGYITGTVAKTGTSGAYINLDSTTVYTVDYRWTGDYNVSIYASKGQVVSTRSDGGTYNLTVYEWK